MGTWHLQDCPVDNPERHTSMRDEKTLAPDINYGTAALHAPTALASRPTLHAFLLKTTASHTQ